MILQGPVDPTPQVAPVVVDQKAAADEKRHQADIENDVALGKKYAAEVEKQEKVSTNQAYIDRVNRIGKDIAEIARTTKVDVFWGDKRLNKFDYSFKVLVGKEDDVNAFSLPGGFIYIYEGLIKYAESDDEIAAVIAHEISHAEERHIATLSREQTKVQTPALLVILAAIASGNPGLIEGSIVVGMNAAQAFTSGWSIKAEKAADHGGFQYLVKSRYNPTAMLTFMERLAQDQHNDALRSWDWGIYQSHPLGRERAEAILKDMRAYGIPVQRSAVSTRYRAEVVPGKEGGVEIWFNKRKLYTFGGSDALSRADEASVKLNAFFDQEPSLFDISFDRITREIVGRRSPLIRVMPEDAETAKISTEAFGEKAVSAIKGSLYYYAFSVWVK